MTKQEQLEFLKQNMDQIISQEWEPLQVEINILRVDLGCLETGMYSLLQSFGLEEIKDRGLKLIKQPRLNSREKV